MDRNGETMNCIGYCRVSTSSQANEGISLEAQVAKIRAWSVLNNCESVTIFTDAGLSGGRADNRPALQQALTTVKKGDVLVVYSLSRLARSVKDTIAIGERLDKQGANLVSLSESLDTTTAGGRMLFKLLAVMAEFERDLVSERTKMAMAHKRSKHEHTGGRVPYGYKIVGHGLEQDANEQRAITSAVEMRVLGLSLRDIGKKLTGQGYKTRCGGEWKPSTLAGILERKP